LSAKRHGWRWVAAAALAMLALSVWAVLNAAHFFAGPASPPVKADLIAVLGGDGGDRGLTAARLYASGMAPRVLIEGLEATPSLVRRAILNWRVQVLVDAGVPLAQLEYDTESANSWEEALNTRRLMQARGWRRVLVVSDPPHMRRLSWTWGRVFEGSGLEFSLVASSPPDWKPDIWWRDEKSGAAVIMECIKIAYYLAKY
jgi:uncharacterized SAM-binding protein YcdF (DUF218 family)